MFNDGYQLKLTDATDSIEYDLLEVPITQTDRIGKKTVVTKDGNISTYYNYKKQVIKHRWAYMTNSQYQQLRAFFDRQYQTGHYPKLTITKLGINEMPVALELSERKIIRNDGLTEGVELTMTETGAI